MLVEPPERAAADAAQMLFEPFVCKKYPLVAVVVESWAELKVEANTMNGIEKIANAPIIDFIILSIKVDDFIACYWNASRRLERYVINRNRVIVSQCLKLTIPKDNSWRMCKGKSRQYSIRCCSRLLL